MENFLTETERESLRIQHKKERDKRVCDRIKAVLLCDKGWSYQEIAEVLLLTEEAVRQHVQDYQASCKLKPENGGSTGKLNKEQAEALKGHLQVHTYLYTKEIVAYSDFKNEVLGFLEGLFNPTIDILDALKRRITDNFHVVGSFFANSSI